MSERRKLEIEWKCPECGEGVCQHMLDAMNGHAREAERLTAEVARLTREVAEAREALTQNARDAIGVINDLALERQRCAAAESALSEAQAEVQRLKAEKCKGCQETIARHREAEDQRAAANVALSEAREVVRNCATQMAHASMFVQSREKMHVAGLALFLSASESARSWLARLDAQGVTK